MIAKPYLLGVIGLTLLTSSAISAIDVNSNGLSDVWEQRFNASSLTLFGDEDGDSFSNIEECIAGTDPFDSTDLPKLTLSVVQQSTETVELEFKSLYGKYYSLEGAAELSVFEPLIVNWPGNGDLYSLELENGVPSAITSPVRADFWSGIHPATMDTLVTADGFPDQPDGSVFLSEPEAPRFVATGFGARLSLSVSPPQTGSYRFYVSSAGPAELYFGTLADGSDASKIAEILPAQTGLSELEWERFDTQRADPLNLDGTVNYYLELRYVAATTRQFAQIGWSGPGLSGIEMLDKEALAEVSFPSEFLLPTDAALLEHDYDQSGQTGALWSAYSSIVDGTTVDMLGNAEHMTTNTGTGAPTYSFISPTTDTHLYASWLFNLGSAHGTLSLFFKNLDAGNGEEGPRIDLKSLSSGTVAAVTAGGTGGNQAQINVAFNQTFRAELITSIEPLGFNYSTPLGSATVAADRFDLYVSDLSGNLVGSALDLTFRDGGDDVVQQFNLMQAILGTNPNIYFDDWSITNGEISGNGYLLANRTGLSSGAIPKFFKLSTFEFDQDGDGLADWEELALALFYSVLFFDAETTDGIPDSDVLAPILALSQGKPDVMLYGTDAAAFESNYPNIIEDKGEITLIREGSLEPLDVQLCFPPLEATGSVATVCDGTCCMLIGSAGDEEAEPEDFILTDEDGRVITDTVHFEFGETTKVLTLTAVKDSINEYPETVNIAIKVSEDDRYDVSTLLNGASIQIFDLPDSPDNLTLFTGAFSQDGAATVATTASGSITATLNGPRTEIKLWSTFTGLTSTQTTSHVHKANQASGSYTPGDIIFGINQEGASEPLLGNIEAHVWDLLSSSGATSSNTGGGPVETSKQIIIDSLFGQNDETPLYLNIHTSLNTAGEIWAFLGLSEGSIDEPAAPDPPAAPGSASYPQLYGDLLEVEVRRFLNQSTFGASEDMVDAMLAKIDAERASDSDYHRHTAYEEWLDAQMDRDTTTQTYLLDYLIATHFQLFWLSGVYDPVRNPTDGNTDTPITPSPWPHIERSESAPEYWFLSSVYPGNFNELELASANGLGVDRRFVKLPHYTMTHWHTMLNAGDQLRQKMGYALQQIVVTSNSADDILLNRYGMVNYQDMLNHHAFNYYRDVLGFVNWSPVMGVWLSSMKNQKAIDFDGDGLFDSYPDENLARENMQLFSIGLFDLWSDGTLKLTANGLPRQTYTNDDIKEFARIITGQSIYHSDGTWGGDAPGSAGFSENTNFNQALFAGQTSTHLFYPMKMFEDYHSFGSKTFAGVTIDNSHITDLKLQAETDIEDAIDWLAGKPGDGLPDFDMVNSHVSTPAFISLRLIQRFTTSNPSKAYLHRVATVFKESEGHLGLTLKAILLDPEARNIDLDDSVFGMKKSPLEGYLQLLRTLEASTYIPLTEPSVGSLFDAAPGDFSNPDLYLQNFGYPAEQIAAHERNVRFFLDSAYSSTGSAGLQMNPFDQETVFNYYVPEYIPGGAIGAADLFAPEMQIVNEADVIRNINYFEDIIRDGLGPIGDELGNSDSNQVAAFGGVSAASTNDYMRLNLQALADEFFPASAPESGLTTITRGSTTTVAPYWVRLSRSGDQFTSSVSVDGITWSMQETWTVAMADQVYIGLAFSSHVDGLLGTAVFDDISLVGASSVWANSDVGDVAAAGSVNINVNGEYELQASGVDIWSLDDEFHFMYQTLVGDGEITAQVKSITNTHIWSKAGVMIRESLSSDSRNVFTLVSSSMGVASQVRMNPGGRSRESIADEALVDALDDRLTNGMFRLRYPYDASDNGVDDINKNPREWIIDTITESYGDPYDGSSDSADRKSKLSDALYLLSVSPEFQVKK